MGEDQFGAHPVVGGAIVDTPITADESLRREEERVAERSAPFRKELGLHDLVLTQILFVVGTVWVGAAAKLGHSQLVFWALAILLFYLPQAAVVIYLSRRMPLEGGLYQWTRLGLSEPLAFLVVWNLWLFAVVLLGSIGLVVATSLAYAAGSAGAWMAQSKTFIIALDVVIIGALAAASLRGLGISKWVHSAGSVMLLTAFAALIALPFIGRLTGTLASYHPLAVTAPSVSLFSLNVFGKLAVGALSGFEYVAVLAGECRNPERTIGRSVAIAAPIIAAMFIFGTSAVLAYVPTDRIDLIAPIPQVLSTGLGHWRIGAFVAPIIIVLVTARTVGNSSVIFTATTRMPMVAGWDQFIPAWFGRVHPRLRTPVNSILFVAAMALAFSIAGIAGVGEQEGFQLLDNAAGIFYALTYLVLFAIPVVGLRRMQLRPPRLLVIAAAAGFCTTLLYVVLSIFPIIDVPSWWSFALKISGVIVVANLVGALVLVGGLRRRMAGNTPVPAAEEIR